jgi:hypothetical protein
MHVRRQAKRLCISLWREGFTSCWRQSCTSLSASLSAAHAAQDSKAGSWSFLHVGPKAQRPVSLKKAHTSRQACLAASACLGNIQRMIDAEITRWKSPCQGGTAVTKSL